MLNIEMHDGGNRIGLVWIGLDWTVPDEMVTRSTIMIRKHSPIEYFSVLLVQTHDNK